MILTPRQSLVLKAILVYVDKDLSNINDFFTHFDGSFVVNGEDTQPIEETEIIELWSLAGGN
jgi:hypothetical protein